MQLLNAIITYLIDLPRISADDPSSHLRGSCVEHGTAALSDLALRLASFLGWHASILDACASGQLCSGGSMAGGHVPALPSSDNTGDEACSESVVSSSLWEKCHPLDNLLAAAQRSSVELV
eukprot:3104677-Prymnesium_polylepis.1